MQTALIAFPFRPTFQRLELEKLWWHRLAIVIFFVLVVCAAVFTGLIAYSVFAPQVATMPDIQTGFLDQPRLSTEADVNSILTEADRSALPANVPLPPQGSHVQGTMTLKQLGQRVKAKYPVYTDLDDEALARSILAKYPQYHSVVSNTGNNIQIDPKTEENVSSTSAPKPSDEAYWSLDLTTFEPIAKLIQMPDGSTSRLRATVSDDIIRAQWKHAKTRQTSKAIMWAGLFIVAAALFISYLFQLAYRALLYVIFGNEATA